MHNHSNEVPFHALHDHELLTIEDPAEVLRTPVNTMRWWRQVGREPPRVTVDRDVDVSDAAPDEHVAQRPADDPRAGIDPGERLHQRPGGHSIVRRGIRGPIPHVTS